MAARTHHGHVTEQKCMNMAGYLILSLIFYDMSPGWDMTVTFPTKYLIKNWH